jgi:hypothetical protein
VNGSAGRRVGVERNVSAYRRRRLDRGSWGELLGHGLGTPVCCLTRASTPTRPYADTPTRFPPRRHAPRRPADTFPPSPTRRYVSAQRRHADTLFSLRLERIMGNNNGGPASINMPTRAQLGDGMFAVFFEQQCCSGGDQTPNYKKDRKN